MIRLSPARWGIRSAASVLLCLVVAGPAAQALDEAGTNRAADRSVVQDDSSRIAIEGTVVDESGALVPNVRVRVRSSMSSVPAALSDGQGVFRFSLDAPSARYLTFLADNLKDGRRGYVCVHEEGTIRLPGPVKIVLKPPRDLIVQVTDADGGPIGGALVVVSELMWPIDEGLTEADGTVRLRLPHDAKLESVLALKSGRGFDFWPAQADPHAGARELPPKLALTLSGATTLRIRAVDSRNRPVPGVDVLPWIIKTGRREGEVNLSGVRREQLPGMTTGADGAVTVDWLPADFAGRITFLTTSREFHLPDPPQLHEKPREGTELTMGLVRCTPISGRVLTPDGHPAAGITLQAEGRGNTNHYYRGIARTNAAGEFQFDAYPGQVYLVAVLDEKWAATSQFVAKVEEDVPISGLELRLGPGTLLRGLATDADGRPRAGATVTLVQSHTLPAGDPKPGIALVRWARTDAEGRYEFRIGPGGYDLFDPEHKARVALQVNDQPEIVRDFPAK